MAQQTKIEWSDATINEKRIVYWKADDKELLTQPLRWRKPRMIFVCAHGDLFHESVPDEWIDRVFAVMALAPHHTFQVLTKRPERMREYLLHGNMSRTELGRIAVIMDAMDELENRGSSRFHDLPLPNVWLGTSVEDQATADQRIPQLLAAPAAVRFVSAEPLLGPIDLLQARTAHNEWEELIELDWVIVGGESGRHARPMHPDWATSLRDQCTAAAVPFFFKQWGEWGPDQGPPDNSRDRIFEGTARCAWLDQKGTWNFEENVWLVDAAATLNCGDWLFRLGKRANGRKLDDREWNEVPT